MTKEELKTEATEFEENYTVYEVAKRKDGTDYTKKVCKVTVKEAYLAGAEPRERRITELEGRIKKMKQDLDNARENANKQEQWEIYSVLNDIFNDNFEVITSVSN